VAFLPVDISDLRKPPKAQAGIPVAPSMVELRLQNGRSLHFDGTLDGAILLRLI
jgi:transposase